MQVSAMWRGRISGCAVTNVFVEQGMGKVSQGEFLHMSVQAGHWTTDRCHNQKIVG